jgi:hypothetical protein
MSDHLIHGVKLIVKELPEKSTQHVTHLPTQPTDIVIVVVTLKNMTQLIHPDLVPNVKVVLISQINSVDLSMSEQLITGVKATVKEPEVKFTLHVTQIPNLSINIVIVVVPKKLS